jgi:hypothetical protein
VEKFARQILYPPFVIKGDSYEALAGTVWQKTLSLANFFTIVKSLVSASYFYISFSPLFTGLESIKKKV